MEITLQLRSDLSELVLDGWSITDFGELDFPPYAGTDPTFAESIVGLLDKEMDRGLEIPTIGALELSHVDECVTLWQNEDMAWEVDFRIRLIRAISRTSDLSCSASVGNKVVGCALALYNEFSVYVHRLVVHPDFRNQGIGTRIMAHLEQAGRQLGAEKVILNAEGRSADWYERLGYKRTDATFFFKEIELL